MYIIDLAKLAGCSKGVAMTRFGDVDANGKKIYTDWLKSKLNEASLLSPSGPLYDSDRSIAIHKLMQDPRWESDLDNALREAWKIKALMPDGPEAFAAKISAYITRQKNQEPKWPIYPVINSQWKSDAWLTGLFLFAPDTPILNPENIGYGLNAGPIPERTLEPVNPDYTYDVLYIDDASYSGTQAFNLMNNIFFSGLRPRRIYIMLCGLSSLAQEQIGKSLLFQRSDCKPYMDPGITTLINTRWDITLNTQKLLQQFFNSAHIEADPRTIKPRPTKGHMPIFMDNCLTMLPYKIPDSISVPTHLYLAYDPVLKASIFESEGGHIFVTNGGVNYRDVMVNNAAHYAQKI